jgi:hypothetical protein
MCVFDVRPAPLRVLRHAGFRFWPGSAKKAGEMYQKHPAEATAAACPGGRNPGLASAVAAKMKAPPGGAGQCHSTV